MSVSLLCSVNGDICVLLQATCQRRSKLTWHDQCATTLRRWSGSMSLFLTKFKATQQGSCAWRPWKAPLNKFTKVILQARIQRLKFKYDDGPSSSSSESSQEPHNENPSEPPSYQRPPARRELFLQHKKRNAKEIKTGNDAAACSVRMERLQEPAFS